MNLLKAVATKILEPELLEVRETVRAVGDGQEFLLERIAELEKEDIGWIRIGDENLDFSRDMLRKISRLGFIYWLKNPLVKSAVRTQTLYVFGQGVSFTAEHPGVNQVIQRFIDDPKNKTELTSQQARTDKENELQIFANLFFVFFSEKKHGCVRVRTIQFSEIDDIIYNPKDSKDPWYYKRVWTPLNGTQITWYYPDWRYKAKDTDPKPTGGEIQEVPLYHVKVNCISGMKFGVSEVYAAIDWARAYKEFLENWATIVRSYARFAWNLTTKGGKKAVADVKAKLKSIHIDPKAESKRIYAAGHDPVGEQYKTPQTGSMFITGEANKLEPIKTAGATTSADDGRRLLLMVSSATGIFEHYLSGDPSTGNLATAKSMERPMELMFVDRQTLWRSIFEAILQYVIDQAALAKDIISGQEVQNEWDEPYVVLENDTENPDVKLAEQPISRHLDITFPAILEKDVVARVTAIIDSATLKGQALAGSIPDMKMVSRMLLTALEVEDVDEALKTLFPDDGSQTGVMPATMQKAAEVMAGLKDGVLESIKKLTEALKENEREAS